MQAIAEYQYTVRGVTPRHHCVTQLWFAGRGACVPVGHTVQDAMNNDSSISQEVSLCTHVACYWNAFKSLESSDRNMGTWVPKSHGIV